MAPRKQLGGWYVYAALLVASQLYQFARPDGSPDPAKREVSLPRFAASGPVAGAPVELRYLDIGAGTPVIYLHGSPGAGSDGRLLAEELADGYRTLAPDLPGFRDSSAWIPDYGIATHARYMLEFMDALEIRQAHVIAHSMGSGVAYYMADLAPERVLSISAYGGIGVQEVEGSGDYGFEHFKYAVGYVGLVVVPELIPHFGWLGPRGERHALIRNFLDTDQRPLRPMLERLRVPLLLVQGRDDPLVPVRAAEEHHRIVRASELVILDASHFLVFSRRGARRLADEIRPFLDYHDDPAHAARRRTTDSSPGPRRTTPLPSELRLAEGIGPWGQVLILIAANFVSEDLTSISAGLLVRDLQLDLFVALVGCVLGIFVTDLAMWLVGLVVGRRALRWNWVSRRVSPVSVERFGRRLDRHLGKAVFASRFLPGTRVAVYLTAGVVGRRPLAFVAWLFAAALVWTPVLVVASMLVGPAVARPFQALLGVGWLSWLAAIAVLFMAIRTLSLALTWAGRQRLKASVSRLWRWEFWPVWLFYLPVVPWIVWLAIRYRGLTIPTVANPALPQGGFVGESKHEILSRLPREWVVPSCPAHPGCVAQRMAAIRSHAAQHEWALPLVLKPDAGQRGVGLHLARSWSDVEAYLQRDPRTVLVQTYDPGPYEAGIFYYRHPCEPAGKIFSITDKKFPEVVGDGRSTVEQLILAHRRLRMQAKTFQRRHADRLDVVLAPGERLRLAVAGNHCQGTMFLDGASLITPELERAVDSIARTFAGFFFGRFDIRYGSVEGLRKGHDLRIVELNGVTSESTQIYDPDFGLLRAYGTLARQWSLAFRIGHENRSRGHRPSSLTELARVTWRHYRERGEAGRAD